MAQNSNISTNQSGMSSKQMFLDNITQEFTEKTDNTVVFDKMGEYTPINTYEFCG